MSAVRMKTTYTRYAASVLPLCLGIVLGSGIVYWYSKNRERSEQLRVEQAWKIRAPLSWNLYYGHSMDRVPIPRDIDLSTNSWRQLVFWTAFARAYVYTDTNTPHNVLRSYGIRMSDPKWMEWVDEVAGYELGYRAKVQTISGKSYREVVEWVSTNFDYPPQPSQPW